MQKGHPIEGNKRSSYIRREDSHISIEYSLLIEHHNAIFSKKDQNLVLKRRLENGILIEETKVENFSQKEECLLSGQRRKSLFIEDLRVAFL